MNVNLFFGVCAVCLCQNHASLIGSNDSNDNNKRLIPLFHVVLFIILLWTATYMGYTHVDFTIKWQCAIHIAWKIFHMFHKYISPDFIDASIVWSFDRLIVYRLLNHLSSFLIYDLEKSWTQNVLLILLIYSCTTHTNAHAHTSKKSIFPNHLTQREHNRFMLKTSQHILYRNQAFFLWKLKKNMICCLIFWWWV